MTTWDDFEREFRKQFYHECATDEARAKLGQLTQNCSLREYVREFSELMLQVPNMSENEALFCFKDGLKHWEKLELDRRGVQDVATAMSVAESLTEFSKDDRSSQSKPRFSQAKGGGDQGKRTQAASSSGREQINKQTSRNGDRREKKVFACYIYQWNHFA